MKPKKEMSKDEAKIKVENYLKEHESAEIKELISNLGIDIRMLVEIIDELKKEDKIHF